MCISEIALPLGTAPGVSVAIFLEVAVEFLVRHKGETDVQILLGVGFHLGSLRPARPPALVLITRHLLRRSLFRE